MRVGTKQMCMKRCIASFAVAAVALHGTASIEVCCIALLCVAARCVALDWVSLRCIALRGFALRCLVALDCGHFVTCVPFGYTCHRITDFLAIGLLHGTAL